MGWAHPPGTAPAGPGRGRLANGGHDGGVAERSTPGITKHERKTGVRYEVRWRPGPGEPEQSRSFPTYEAARAWRTQVDAARLQGQRLDPRAGKRLFRHYVEEWLADRPLADRTRELYAHQLKAHILPAFGDKALSRITSSSVRAWHGKLAARGGVVAPKCYRLLRSIMATAVEDGLIASNPCMVKGAGVEESAERPFVEPAVVLELVEVAHPRIKPMILVAAFGGLRLGELRALRLRDFNELAGTLKVGESIDPQLRRKAPKTAAGRRVVVLPAPVVQAVAQHVAEYGQGADGPLFPGELGAVISTSFVSKHWCQARAEVGREDVHFHDLRHTAGTLTAQAGATLRELMTRIGHSSPRAAMRYQHAAQSRDVELAQRIGDLMAPRDTRGTSG